MIRTYLKVVKAFRTGVCGKDGDNMARQHYGHKKHMKKFTITGIIVKCREYKSQISELKKEKKSVDERKEDLKEFEKYVDTDEYVEQIARERLGLVYKGEVIFEPDDSK